MYGTLRTEWYKVFSRGENVCKISLEWFMSGYRTGVKKLINESKSAADGQLCFMCSNEICHVTIMDFPAFQSSPRLSPS